MMAIYDNKRKELLDTFDFDWADDIPYYDQRIIVSGNDKECIRALKKHNLCSEQIERKLKGFKPRCQIIDLH